MYISIIGHHLTDSQNELLQQKIAQAYPGMPIRLIREPNAILEGPGLLLIDFDPTVHQLPSRLFDLTPGLTAWADYQLNQKANKFPFLKEQNSGEFALADHLPEEHHDGLAAIGAYYYSHPLKLKDYSLNGQLINAIRLAPALPCASTATPALFLDRDGVINEDTEYLYHPDELVLRPGVEKLIQYFNRLNYPVICLTNQSGVARGKFSEQQVHALHREIDCRLEQLGARIDHYEISPFHFEKGQGIYKKHSILRKPQPGMLLLACRHFAIDLSRSVMVGDKDSDCLKYANLQTFLIPGLYPLASKRGIIVNNFQEILNTIGQ